MPQSLGYKVMLFFLLYFCMFSLYVLNGTASSGEAKRTPCRVPSVLEARALMQDICSNLVKKGRVFNLGLSHSGVMALTTRNCLKITSFSSWHLSKHKFLDGESQMKDSLKGMCHKSYLSATDMSLCSTYSGATHSPSAFYTEL